MDVRNSLAISWKFLTGDGQTLYIQKLSHSKNNNNDKTVEQQNSINSNSQIKLKQIDVLETVVRLTVKDLETSRFFYEKILGVKVQKESTHSVRYGSLFLFQSSASTRKLLENFQDTMKQQYVSIFIKVSNLDDVHHNVSQCKVTQLTEISERQGKRFFKCLDPDSNSVEVFEEEF